MMLLSIKDTTTTFALNCRSKTAGINATNVPVAIATTYRTGTMMPAGRLAGARLSAAQVTMQAEIMKMPSTTRLNLLTAYIKHIARPQMVNGMARLMRLPMRRADENGPATNS